MNFYQFCTNFIFNDRKSIALITSPIEFLNIVLIMSIISLFFYGKEAKYKKSNVIIIGILFCINKIFFNPYISYCLIIIEAVILFKIQKKENFVDLVSQLIISISCMTVLLILFSKIFGNKNNLFEITNQILSTIIISNLYAINKKIKLNIDKLKNINKKEIIKNTLIISTIIISVCLQAISLKRNSFIESIEIALLNVLTILLFAYVMISNLSKTREIREASVYIDNLEVRNKNLTEVNDKIRGFKHDFNNIVQAMNGYIMLEDLISLKKYFKKLMIECNEIKNVENLSPKIIQDPAIYSLLLNKYNVAQELGIKVNFEIPFNFSKISDNSYDISRILGILLDNAIEASEECDEKIINIRFIEKRNIKGICIENTYDKNKEIDTNKIFEKNFTTKNKKGNQGIGLWEVKKILNKNKELELYTIKKDEFFIQSLEIYENPIG